MPKRTLVSHELVKKEIPIFLCISHKFWAKNSTPIKFQQKNNFFTSSEKLRKFPTIFYYFFTLRHIFYIYVFYCISPNQTTKRLKYIYRDSVNFEKTTKLKSIQTAYKALSFLKTKISQKAFQPFRAKYLTSSQKISFHHSTLAHLRKSNANGYYCYTQCINR